MNSLVPLVEFVESAGSQTAAGQKLDCSQPAIRKAMARGDVFVELQNDEVIEAFSKKPFPDPRMRKQKTPSVS